MGDYATTSNFYKKYLNICHKKSDHLLLSKYFYLDQNESVKLGDGADAVLHLVLGHLENSFKTLQHSFKKAFPPSFPFSIIFSTSLPHLNKLTIFFLLEKRIEPVHRHPVMLLDLGEADPEDYMLMIMDDQLQLLM